MVHIKKKKVLKKHKQPEMYFFTVLESEVQNQCIIGSYTLQRR